MIASLLALALTSQFPGGPFDLGEDLRWARSGAPSRGFVTVLSDTTLHARALQCDGALETSRPCCVPWGAQVTLQSDKAVTICLSMTATVSIGTSGSGYGTELAHLVTDANGKTGMGACFDIQAIGQTFDAIPLYETLSQAVGARQGMCSEPNTDRAIPGHNAYSPCRVDGDCTSVGPSSSTCNTAATITQMKQYSCSYFVPRPNAATTRVSATVQR